MMASNKLLMYKFIGLKMLSSYSSFQHNITRYTKSYMTLHHKHVQHIS